MMNYMLTDKGIAAFARAHDVARDDLLSFLEMKKSNEDMDQQPQMSPPENDEKHEEGKPKCLVHYFIAETKLDVYKRKILRKLRKHPLS